MASGWTAREEVLTVGRTVLLGAAWILATACTYLTEDGGWCLRRATPWRWSSPDNCEAHRTASGYTVSCSEGSGDAAGDSTTTSEFAATEGVALGEGAPPPARSRGRPLRRLCLRGGNVGERRRPPHHAARRRRNGSCERGPGAPRSARVGVRCRAGRARHLDGARPATDSQPQSRGCQSLWSGVRSGCPGRRPHRGHLRRVTGRVHQNSPGLPRDCVAPGSCGAEWALRAAAARRRLERAPGPVGP